MHLNRHSPPQIPPLMSNLAKNKPLVINLKLFILLSFADLIYLNSFIPTLAILALKSSQ